MYRVLVVEDDPHILRLISMWLKRQGYEVLEARNGVAAQQILQQQAVDLLISDVNMPGLDGVALVESVVGLGCVRRGIVMLTNRWDHGEIRDRLAEWGVRVLPKPFSPSGLSELVHRLLGNKLLRDSGDESATATVGQTGTTSDLPQRVPPEQ